jgi:hypothetical protein
MHAAERPICWTGDENVYTNNISFDKVAVQRWKIWGVEAEATRWDPRLGKENREIAGANCVLGMKIFLLHPQKLDIGNEIYSIC